VSVRKANYKYKGHSICYNIAENVFRTDGRANYLLLHVLFEQKKLIYKKYAH